MQERKTIEIEKRVAARTVDYTVAWRWASDRYVTEETVRATTAPRAIAKLRKKLEEQYDFRALDLVIDAAYPV